MISCCPYVLSLSPGDKPGGLLLCFRYGTVFCIRKVSRGKIFSLWNTVDTNLLNKGAWRGVVKGNWTCWGFFPLLPCIETLVCEWPLTLYHRNWYKENTWYFPILLPSLATVLWLHSAVSVLQWITCVRFERSRMTLSLPRFFLFPLCCCQFRKTVSIKQLLCLTSVSQTQRCMKWTKKGGQDLEGVGDGCHREMFFCSLRVKS